jgi:uncharacterized protein (TIGR03435 family)
MPIALGIIDGPVRLHAQVKAPPSMQFEVASVKPNTSGQDGFSINPSHGNYAATNVTVMRLITSSFRIQNSQVIGGPSWLDTARFDVAAKGAENSTNAELSLMVQRLLLDRFKLAFDMETKELPIYALTVGKDGPKLRKAEDGTCAAAIKASKPCVNLSEFKNGLVASNLSLPNIARALGRILGDRVVVDQTGLTGQYDIAAMWTNGAARPPEEPENHRRSESPESPFVALEEQAGLKLRGARGLVDVLVIDRLEKPSAN